ncbi:DUF2188 domain-containing protein [Paenibacillus lacisoli]|uniref:hypothetical protein n=1 Tax=Paenibacillus lacisoli TaxID=3064525 RepID=UPI0031F2D8F7
MPWNKKDYPPSMKNLDPRIRNKAVEIANALLEEGYEEGRSIAIATARAEEWNENHPEHEDDDKNSKDKHTNDTNNDHKDSNQPVQ